MALIYNASFDSQTRVLSLLDKAGNVISSCEVPSKSNELTLTATADNSSVKLTKNGTLSNTYEVDTGNGWQSYSFGTVINLNNGQSCKWRCSAHPTTQSFLDYVQFNMTGTIEASGNYNSMLSSDFENLTSLSGYDYAFYKLFSGCKSLTRAPELPATTLSYCCYFDMFNYCKGLTQAPVLPATTLEQNCYNSMFANCTSLTKAPELPATTLAQGCYSYMFDGCSNLNEVRCNMSSSYSASDISSSYAKNWLEGVSATGTFYTNADANWSSGVSGIPTGWTRVPAVDDITKPLTLKATQDGSTVSLTKKGSPSGDFQTSTDGGNTWTDYTLGTAITLNTGDEVSFRSKTDRTSKQDTSRYFQFEMTGKIEAWHNVMSMIRTNDFATYESVVDCAFYGLLKGCTSLTKAPALPATTLAVQCYQSMFRECQSLTKAPELPATTLADQCYQSMFDGCQSLIKAPELPATTLARYCYLGMFSGCQSLIKAPELPATKLAYGCYYSMFDGCQSLIKAPELPATTLANYCYYNMFYGCKSLTKAPELPATTLARNCYYSMFSGCQSLKEVRISATTTESYALDNWLKDVSATGDFYCDPNATIFPTDSVSGIPTGWTRHNIADYPN